MARDHALAQALDGAGAAGSDRAVLRLYRWSAPTLSLGRNEPARARFDPARLAAAGVDVVRRPTGGRAVLHDRELTYAVALPARALGGVRDAYVAVNRGLRRGLASLGVPAEIAGDGGGEPPPGPDAGPCFREPAPGELVAAGRKLVGSAQARVGGTLLQHGSILVADDQDRIASLVRPTEADAAPEGTPATLTALLDGDVPSWEQLERAVVDGLREELGGRWEEEPAAVDPALESEMLERYRSDGWTWRR